MPMKVTVLANYADHAARGLMQGSDREAAIKSLFELAPAKNAADAYKPAG